MNKLIVGCPVKNDLTCLRLMIESLINSTWAYDTIFIYDGGSDKETLDYLYDLVGSHTNIDVVFGNTKTPLEAYNKLFEMAKDNHADLLLTQTDVIFPKLYNRDWLIEMKIAAQDKNIGAITTLNGGKHSGPDYIDGMYWLGGWCTYLPYRTIEKLGGYDENFPNGFGVDIDYTYRIFKEGLKIAIINYWVDHHMANTREHDTNSKAEEMKQESSKWFKMKWGLS
jgi:GT2 family glycosyltransferase